MFFDNYPKEKLEKHIFKSLEPKTRTAKEEYEFWVNLEKEIRSRGMVKEKLGVRVMDFIRGYGPITLGVTAMFVGTYLMNELDPVHVAHPELKEKLFFIEEPKRLKNYLVNYYEELTTKTQSSVKKL